MTDHRRDRVSSRFTHTEAVAKVASRPFSVMPAMNPTVRFAAEAVSQSSSVNDD
jgi:hypothetical protein